jgi:hypothetical protein
MGKFGLGRAIHAGPSQSPWGLKKLRDTLWFPLMPCVAYPHKASAAFPLTEELWWLSLRLRQTLTGISVRPKLTSWRL